MPPKSTSAAAPTTDTARLFAEIERAADAQHYERAADLCDAVLKVDPNDSDAALAKAVLLLRLGRYEAALTFLARRQLPPADVAFERAYALYRLGRLVDALDVLGPHAAAAAAADADAEPRRVHLLRAQLHYKLEHYADAARILAAVAEATEPADPEYNEVLTNLAAAQAAAAAPLHAAADAASNATFELAYNASLAALAAGDADRALMLIDTAEQLCRDALTGDDLTDELAPILVHKAHVLQHAGRSQDALQLYTSVLQSKPSDGAAVAIASNNVVSIKQEKDLFDAAKKLKQAEAYLGKLSLRQRQIIDNNNALLLMYMNKSQPCREACAKLAQKYPAASTQLVILAAVAQRERKNAAAALADITSRLPALPAGAESDAVRSAALMLKAQLEAGLGAFDQSLASLMSLGDRLATMPAILSVVLALHDKLARTAEAVELIKRATAQQNAHKTVLVLAARYHHMHGNATQAAELYEQAVARDPDNIQAISGLIKTYALANPALADKFDARLPPLEPAADVDVLEALVAQSHFRPRGTLAAAGSRDASQQLVKDSKPKAPRKRKPRLPKNYNPAVAPDPERWLPLRERSTYRKSRKQRDRDREMSKGASQGAAPTPAASSSAASAAAAASKGPHTQPSAPAVISPPPSGKTSAASGKKRAAK